MEVTADTRMSDATATLLKSDENASAESELASAPPAETSDGSVSSDVPPGLVLTAAASPSLASPSDSSLSQTHVPTCQPEPPETGTTSH